LTVVAMLEDAGYKVPKVNMDAYMKARSLTQEFIDDFLGYYIDPSNRQMTALLIGSGLPGGMMGSLKADLANNLASINRYLEKNDKSTLTQDELMIKLYDEVEHIWPMMGYPPLVTPYSQYVKNVALMNVMQMIKGKERFSMIDDNTWDMMLGKQGQLPGELAPELVELAKSQGREFYTGNPQDLYPNDLDSFREEMEKNGWEFGKDDEELLELAMHPEQYRNYKSGKAKEDFEADLAKKKTPNETTTSKDKPAATTGTDFSPKTLNIDVNGEKFLVKVSYGDADVNTTESHSVPTTKDDQSGTANNGNIKEIIAPLEGRFFLVKNPSDKPVKVGDTLKKGDVIGYIESMKVYNAITTDFAGKVVEVCQKDGDTIMEDDVLIKLQ
ncbi:MAG: biotin/lipoyl-containing protein, partial [Cyclobacteriaceae bacterium]